MYIPASQQFNQQNFNAAVGAGGFPPPFLPPSIPGGIPPPPPPQILAPFPAPIPIPSSAPSSSTPNSSHTLSTASKNERMEETEDRVRN